MEHVQRVRLDLDQHSTNSSCRTCVKVALLWCICSIIFNISIDASHVLVPRDDQHECACPSHCCGTSRNVLFCISGSATALCTSQVENFTLHKSFAQRSLQWKLWNSWFIGKNWCGLKTLGDISGLEQQNKGKGGNHDPMRNSAWAKRMQERHIQWAETPSLRALARRS
jgi:hypothetical protein